MFGIVLLVLSAGVTRLIQSVNQTPEQTQERIKQAIASGHDTIAVAQQDAQGFTSVTTIHLPTVIQHSGVNTLSSLFNGLNSDSNAVIVMGDRLQINQLTNNLSLSNSTNRRSVLNAIDNTVSMAQTTRRRRAIAPVDVVGGGGTFSPELRAAIAQSIYQSIFARDFAQVPSQVVSVVEGPPIHSRHTFDASGSQIAAAPTEHQEVVLHPALDPFAALASEEANSLTQPTATVLSDDGDAASLNEHLAQLTQHITDMSLFINSTPKLKRKHSDAINTCIQDLRLATAAFMRAPNPTVFAALKNVSVAKINAMETVLSHQPMIWNMLKPICNALIHTLNAIKKMIWTNARMHSLFNNKSDAQQAWESTSLRPSILNRLEQIRQVVERDATPPSNLVLGGS